MKFFILLGILCVWSLGIGEVKGRYMAKRAESCPEGGIFCAQCAMDLCGFNPCPEDRPYCIQCPCGCDYICSLG